MYTASITATDMSQIHGMGEIFHILKKRILLLSLYPGAHPSYLTPDCSFRMTVSALSITLTDKVNLWQ